MSREPKDQHPYVIACHEAGHLLLARFRDREIEKVSLDLIDGKRGCFYKCAGKAWTDYDEILLLLAGPRAQITFCPKSIEEAKLVIFREKILQPQARRGQRPEIYDNTGWQHDVDPVYVLLSMPDAPVFGLKRMVTRREAHERAENALRVFFSEAVVQSAMKKLAEAIFEKRFLSGKDATELVRSTNVLENPTLVRALSAEA
jgi:hypothetical protein